MSLLPAKTVISHIAYPQLKRLQTARCSGTCGGVVENQGLFRKSNGGDTIISSSILFTNSATVDIQTNALEVRNGWHVGGSYPGAGILRLVGAMASSGGGASAPSTRS